MRKIILIYKNYTETHKITGSTACTTTPCPANTVDVSNINTYLATGGPKGFTTYSLILFIVNIAGTLIFTSFLPANVKECHDWKQQGDAAENCLSKNNTGYISLALSTFLLLYGIIGSIIILDPKVSCRIAFGGQGC